MDQHSCSMSQWSNECGLLSRSSLPHQKWAAQKSRHSEDGIIKMAAMLVRNTVRITAYETDVCL